MSKQKPLFDLRTGVWLAAVGLFGAGAAEAQSASPLLLDLPGQLALVRYSPGALDRATRVQDQVEAMVENFDSWSKERMPLGVFLLSPEDWQETGLQSPYGLPTSMGGRGLALPAWGTEVTVALWQSLLRSPLPTMPSPSVSRGSPEELASVLVADLVAMPRIARIQLKAAGFRSESRWVEGVAGQILALSGVLTNKDPRLPEMRLIYASLEAAQGGPGSYSLEALAAAGSLQRDMWFEAQYFNGASIATQAEGKQSAKKMLRQAQKSGKLLRSADLISIFPGLAEWKRTSFSQP